LPFDKVVQPLVYYDEKLHTTKFGTKVSNSILMECRDDSKVYC
jgi:hypothetical protein